MKPYVVDIVRRYLVNNSYDGLYNLDDGCACLTNNLAPCGQVEECCQPARRTDGALPLDVLAAMAEVKRLTNG